MLISFRGGLILIRILFRRKNSLRFSQNLSKPFNFLIVKVGNRIRFLVKKAKSTRIISMELRSAINSAREE